MLRTLDRRAPGPADSGTHAARDPAETTDPGGTTVRCRACAHVITRTAEAIEVSGDHEHTFVNPHGYLFHIACFRIAPGADASGPSENFFSWFPGYPWRIAVCRGCNAHLGWGFGGPDFYGLIADRLIEGDEPGA